MEYSVHINTLCLVAGKREGGMVAQDNVVVNVFFFIWLLANIVNVFYWPELLMCFLIGQHCECVEGSLSTSPLCCVLATKPIKFAADRNSKVILECSRCKYPLHLVKLSFLIISIWNWIWFYIIIIFSWAIFKHVFFNWRSIWSELLIF